MLDSAESLSEAELELLLPGTLDCSVLVTTQNRFINLERFGKVISLDALPEEHSLSLLRRAAGFQPVSEAQGVALQVCKLLGHHPLALEIAGRLAKNRGWDMPTLLKNLKESESGTSESERDTLSVVTSTIAASYDALTSEQKKVLIAASTFEEDFGTEGVIYLTNIRRETVEYLLDELVNRSLVSRGRDQTFRVHPLIRSHVRKVADKKELKAMRHRHARYMLYWMRKVKEKAK